jgi:hypothetical protein
MRWSWSQSAVNKSPLGQQSIGYRIDEQAKQAAPWLINFTYPVCDRQPHPSYKMRKKKSLHPFLNGSL